MANNTENDHERLIRVEVKQDLLSTAFREHEQHDERRFSAINETLSVLLTTQTKLSTTVKLVGAIIVIISPIITALVIHFTK